MKGKLPAMECLEAVVDANILPWQINVKWSEEAPTLLGDMPDRPPRKMSLAAIHNSFRILRITNQGVTDLDKSVKHFKHLEKLILTANCIKKVDSRFLPPNLEFLELCANAITSLDPICLRPPPLTHLGLGYNHVRTLEGCISASLWPRLLSLDLSFNDLDDLHDVVGKMALLPSLRSLLLLGNPLSLTPGYRGFIVDFLKDLLIFDDVFISSEERHEFHGLAASKKSKVKNAVRVTYEAMTVRGLPAPTDDKPADDNQEFPIVARKYALYFLIPLNAAEIDEERAKAAAAAAAAAAKAAAEAEKDDDDAEEVEEEKAAALPQIPVILEGQGSLTGSVIYPGEEAAAAAAAEADDAVGEGGEAAEEKQKKKIPLPKVEEEIIDVPDKEAAEAGEFAVKPTKTNPVPWSEEMEMNWKKEMDRTDLLVTRNFFKRGMEVHVVEEKVLAYPSDQIEGLESRGASPGDGARSAASKGAAGTKSRGGDAKGGKDAKGGGATAGGSGAERKKKKGDTEVDLYYMPPEVTVLAKCRVKMEEFLDGETELDFVFTKEGDKETVVKTAKRDKDAKEEKEKEAKKNAAGAAGGGGGKGGAGGAGAGGKDEAGKKGGKTEEKPPASKQASERGGKSSATTKSSRGGDKGGGGGKERVGTAENIAEEVAQPPPLECHFRVLVAKWKKAQDATPAAVEKKRSTASKTGGRASGARSANKTDS